MGTSSKLAILEVSDGDFERGFPVTLRIGNTGEPHAVEFREKFPPAPDIPKLHSQWQTAYYRWGVNHRWWRMRQMDFPPQQTNVSYWDELQSAARNLRQGLNHWFDRPQMRNLREHILEEIPQDNPARLIIQTPDALLRRLPWNLWPLLERRPKLEIALSAPYVKTSRQLHNPVRILAILGDDTGINAKGDLEALQGLPNAVTKPLLKPTRQTFNDHLFNLHWDVLFFAGHSHSEPGQETGYICINDRDALSPSDLHHAFKKAAENGIQLAILNSCDGLGLARELADLGIPYVIVMREPVHDRVAQEFLGYFLTNFANGKSFYFSVQEARKKLQGLENDYPCASWLPVICQNPAAPELKYPQWNWRKTGYLSAGAALALAVTVMGVKLVWQEIDIRNRISNGERVLIQEVNNPHKTAGVSAFWWKDYSGAIREFETSLKQIPDDPETLIYLNNAKVGSSPAVEIAVPVPARKNPDVAQQILRGVAQAQLQINRQNGINGKLLQIKIANDDNDPTMSPQLARRFVGDHNIMAVLGHNESNTSIAAAKVYRQGKLVMITPTSNATALTDQTETGESEDGTYIYRTTLKAPVFAEALVDYLIDRGKTKLAICRDSGKGDKSFSDSVIEVSQKKGIKVIDEEIDCDLNEPDKNGNHFDPVTVLNKVKDAGADSLLLSPHVQRLNRAIAVATANANSSYKLPLFGNFTLHQQITLKNGKAFQGMILPTLWSPDLPENVPFQGAARQLWGSLEGVSVRSATAFDAVHAVVNGLKLSAGSHREELPRFLQSPEFPFDGVTGRIEFQRAGDRFGQAILIEVQPDFKASTGYRFAMLNAIETRVSWGEQILMTASKNIHKEAGVQAFGKKDFAQAIAHFQTALKARPDDPETRIYLNNAEAMRSGQFLQIATSVPIGSNPDIAQEILRGVAQAQQQINQDGGMNGKLLVVAIANDDNDPLIAKSIAEIFVRNSQILAVVGSNAGEPTRAAAPIYNKDGLVMITPTSFSYQLPFDRDGYIFRMVPGSPSIANKLADAILQRHAAAKVAVCSDSQSEDNREFRDQFISALQSKGGRLVGQNCDFSSPQFNPNQAVANAIQQGAHALLLSPYIRRSNPAIATAKANHIQPPKNQLQLFSSPTLCTAATLELGQAAVNGLILQLPWHPQTAVGRPFAERASMLWGKPLRCWREAMSYDATLAIAAGLRANPTRQGLRDTLKRADFSVQGASGTIRFTSSGARLINPEIEVLAQVQPSSHSPSKYDFALISH